MFSCLPLAEVQWSVACAVVDIVAVVSVVTGVAGDAVVGETGCCGRPASRQLCHPPAGQLMR